MEALVNDAASGERRTSEIEHEIDDDYVVSTFVSGGRGRDANASASADPTTTTSINHPLGRHPLENPL